MKITVKQQVLLAPALVLLLLTLLLGFMQFTYWDLSVKRREAKSLGTAFISLAEADLASRRMQRLLLQIQGSVSTAVASGAALRPDDRERRLILYDDE